MQHNIPLVGSVILALILFSLTFNLCVYKMTRNSLRGTWAFTYYGGAVRLPLYKSYEYSPKGLHKGYLLLWVSGLLTGIILIAACGLWISTMFDFNQHIQSIRWVPELHRSYMFILNQRIDLWHGNLWFGWAIIIFLFLPLVIMFSAAWNVWSSIRAILRIPVGFVSVNHEKQRLQIETWPVLCPKHLR